MALRENGGQTPKRAPKHAKVVFIHSDELIKLCDNLPKVPNRVSQAFLFHFRDFLSLDISQTFR